MAGKDSLIIGLYGTWGSGKSSVKQMILDALAEHREGPAVLEFNPWDWAAQEKVVDAFYREIGVRLGKTDISDAAHAAAENWRKYAALLQAANVLAETAEWVVGSESLRTSLFSFLTLTGAILGSSPWNNRLRWIFTGILFAAAAVVKFGKDIAKEYQQWKTGKLKEPSLSEVRDDLNNSLLQLQKPLLVVLDDIDRLSASEIRQVIQLVKANANLPNIVYLLLFDRIIVETALDEVSCKRGREFLEKVVQIPFDLPVIEGPKIQRILQDRLQRLFANTKNGFQEDRWAVFVKYGITSYFDSLRDVYRFLSSLAFHANLFKHEDSFEVDTVDLTVIEVLRTFEPEIYQLIRENKRVLTGHSAVFLVPVSQKDGTSLRDKLLKAGRPPELNEKMETLLYELFPPLRTVIESIEPTETDKILWAQELRACVPDYYDRYFLFRSSEQDISESKFRAVVAAALQRETLKEVFSELAAVHLLETLIERLRLRTQDLPEQSIGTIISVLFDFEDKITARRGRLSDSMPFLNGIFLVRQLLRRLQDNTQRYTFMAQALNESAGLYLPMHVLHFEKDGDDRSLFQPQHLVQLREIWLAKIAEAARIGTLIQSVGLVQILEVWRVERVLDCVNWASRAIMERSSLYSILAAYTEREAHISGGRTTYSYRFSLDKLKSLIPPPKLLAQLNMAHFQPLTEDERFLFDLATQYLNRESNPSSTPGLPAPAS